MNIREIRSNVGQIRELAFKGTVPSDMRPKGAANHRDLFRSIMRIARTIEDAIDTDFRNQQHIDSQQ